MSFVPFSIWGLVATGGLRGPRIRWWWCVGAGILVVPAAWSGCRAGTARPTAALSFPEATVRAMLDPGIAGEPADMAESTDPPRVTGGPAECTVAPGTAAQVTVVVTMFDAAHVATDTVCLQAPAQGVTDAYRARWLGARASVGPIKIDLITSTRPLVAFAPAVDRLGLRAGLEGVCDGRRCLMPWQLVAMAPQST